MADLAALTQQANEEQEAISQVEAGEVGGVDESDSWAMIPAMIGGALCMAMPELKTVYTENACKQWGVAMVPVAQKYGWNADALTNSPEIALAFASLPLVLGTVTAIKAKKLENAKAAKAEKSEEKPQTAAQVASPETVVIG